MVLLKGFEKDGFVWSVMICYFYFRPVIFERMLSCVQLLQLICTGTQTMKVERHVSYLKILEHLCFFTGMV